MTIKHFIKRSILFMIISSFIYIIGVIIYGDFFPTYLQKNIHYKKFSHGFSNTRLKEIKDIKDVDILFLGSSRAYRHYDPRIFKKEGYTSFNLGTSSQTFIQTEILVKRYLEKLNPKLIVLDIYPGMFTMDGVESTYDIIANDYNSWESLRMVKEFNNIMIFNSWIYALYQEYFWDSLKDEEFKITSKNRYIEGGYVEREISTYNEGGHWEQVLLIDERQWEAFKRTIEFMKSFNIKFMVVHSPRNSGFVYHGDEKIKDYLASQKIIFHNFKELDFIDDSLHFYDHTHLNQNGTDLYNKFFINILQVHHN